MASDGFLVLEKHRSIFNLILLILFDKTDYYKTNHNDKDCLLAISTTEKLKLEDAKLTLYLLYLHCNLQNNEASIENYLNTTGRTMKNVDSIRRSIRRLDALKIIYLDHNGKRQEQRLFNTCELNRGKIIYQFNSFFKSKLSRQGKGHIEVRMKPFIFVDENYKCHTKNGIRLLVMLYLLYELPQSSARKKKWLESGKQKLTLILDEYRTNRIMIFDQWIEKSVDEFFNHYTV